MHHVMLDIDGTLVESFNFDEECYLDAVLKVLGQEMDSDWTKYEHITDTGILDQYLASVGLSHQKEDIHAKVKAVFINNISKYISLFPVKAIPGAIAFVKNLKEMSNVSLSIATGGWGETATMKLSSAGFDITDIPMASSNDHYSRTEIMKTALMKSDATTKEKVTYFGDAEWDKKACEELNFNFVLIGNRTEHTQNIVDFTSLDKAYNYIGL